MNPTTPTTSTRSAAPVGMPMWAQRALAGVAALALLVLLFAIGKQIAATQPASTPAAVVPAQAGPYALTVALSQDPADAGYALPYAISPTSPVNGTLTYSVMAIPDAGVDATPVNGAVTPDPKAPNRVTGTVEITVQGDWDLHIIVDGPRGQGIADVPIVAKAPPPLPGWIAWPIGLIPAIGLALFFLYQRRASRNQPPGEQNA